jgi:hypothetical protein
MKLIELVICDGCGHKITTPSRAWEFEKGAVIVVVHPQQPLLQRSRTEAGATPLTTRSG